MDDEQTKQTGGVRKEERKRSPVDDQTNGQKDGRMGGWIVGEVDE